MIHKFNSFIGLLILLGLAACVKLPEGGGSKLIMTSVEQEKQLGTQGYQEVLAKEKIITGTPAHAMLLRVGKRIADAANQPGYNWEFTLIESEQQNAWCMPGGKVAFYTGILPALENEAGMAVVMGHEVAHATLRHSGQRITQQQILGLGMAAASVSLSDSKNHDALMGLLGAGTTVGVMLPYGRTHETEADMVGLKYMARAGYDPREAVDFWKRFGKSGAGAPPEFLSTHPAGDTRVNNLRDALPEALKIYKQSDVQHGLGSDL